MMEFTIAPEDLASACAFVTTYLPKNPELDIQRYIHLQAGDGEVTLTASGPDCSAVQTVPAQVAEPGEALVPGRALSEVAKVLPRKRGDVRAHLEDGGLILACGPADVDLRTYTDGGDSDFYVHAPAGEISGTCGAADLAAAIARVAPVTARDNPEPRYHSIELIFGAGKIQLAAFDSQRLADSHLAWTPGPAPLVDCPVLVPGRLIGPVASVLADGDRVSIAVAVRKVRDANSPDPGATIAEPSLITFSAPGRSLTCSLMALRLFPRGRAHLRTMFPAGEKELATLPILAQVETADLVEALSRVTVVAGTDRNVPIAMEMSGDEEIGLHLVNDPAATTRKPVEHKAADAVTAKITRRDPDAGDAVVCVTPAYLREILQAADGAKTVTIGIGARERTGLRRIFVLPQWPEGDRTPARYMLVNRLIPQAQAASAA